MPKRLLDCCASDFRSFTKSDLLESIHKSEGRVIACETIGTVQPLLGNVTNAEFAASMGADILLLNMFDVQHPVINGLPETEPENTVRMLKKLTGRPIGINLEPVAEGEEGETDPIWKMSAGRRATVENALRAKELGVDFILLTGNPGMGVSNPAIIETLRKFKAAVGDSIVLAAGKMHAAGVLTEAAESILTEVERIAAETVFVLPNNKNIVMAAQQCAGLSEKKVIVIPTATVPQGISAMMAVDPDETDAATIEQAMNAAASAVTTAQITYAARTSEFAGFAIREGDYLALLEGKLFDTDTSIGAVLEKLAAEADSRGAEFVNLFYGSDVSEEDAQKAGEQFGRLCPGAEINVVSGGQPVYYYIISME
mgnify:CR=1 FL=1